MTRAKRKHSPARVPPQTEEQLCRAVKRLHAFSEAEASADELQAAQAHSASVSILSNNPGHTEGHAVKSTPLLAADGAVSVPVEDDPTSHSAAVASADGSQDMQQRGNAGQMQEHTGVGTSRPLVRADVGSKEPTGEALKPTAAAEPSRKQQQAEHSQDKGSDQLGPARLDADISQLPERLRHINVSGKEGPQGKERRTSLDSIEEPITPGRTEKAVPGNTAERPASQAADSKGQPSFESLYEEANKLLKNLHFQRLMRHAPASPDRTDERKEASL